MPRVQRGGRQPGPRTYRAGRKRRRAPRLQRRYRPSENRDGLRRKHSPWDTSLSVAATAVEDGLSGGLRLTRLHGCGAVDGLTDSLVRAAAADVAAHGIVDIGVGGVGLFRKQRYRGHDLSRLAVAALRNVFFHPGLLYGMAAIG